MSSYETLDLSMSNIQVIMYWTVPIVTLVSALICLVISKNHIYRVALQLSSIALFSIAAAWTIPLSAEFVIGNIFDLKEDYQAVGEALNFANTLTAILFIVGHMLLAFSFYKFRGTKT